MSKAILKGKTGNNTIRIPYADLVPRDWKYNPTPEDMKYENVDLVITIATEWEERAEDGQEITDTDS